MAMRYPGGFISSTAPTVSANSAKGVWTLEEAMQYIRAGQWPVPTGNGDPFFQYNTMLLPGQGTNGAQNNTFLDSSTNNFTITRNGNTTQGTFTPFSGTAGNWSNFFDGSGDYFTSSTSLFNYTTGNASNETFTIEAYIYHNARSTPSSTEYAQSIAAKGDVYLNFGINGTGNLIFYHYDGSVRSFTGSSVIPLNQWTHVAVRVTGGTATLYVNGVSDGSGTWYGIQAAGLTATSYFGTPALNANARAFNGFTSNLRISNNARTITVPTAPYSNDANTVFLTSQSNRFIDNSSNAYAITPVGGVAVTPFQPFGAPTVAYSASTIGGSGYFDGSGDYLDAGSNAAFSFGTGAYTVECWIYPTSTANQAYVTNDTTNGSVFYYENATGFIIAPRASSGIVSGGAGKLIPNQWNHIVYCRASTSTNQTSIFANGARVANGTDSTNWTITGPCLLGGLANNTYMLSGYMGGVRIVKGTDVYGYNNTSITPPTAPLTAITNTSLLCNFTNAGIIDNAQDNVLETVGGAQISTTQYKWGASSIYFDGTGDWVLAPSSQNIAMGTGDFTIEFWMYLTGVSGEGTTVYNSTSGGINLFMNISSNWGIARSGVGVDNNFGTPPAQNQWNHIAVSRSGSTIKAFINGNQVFAGANTSNYVAGPIQIGGSSFGTITGYIQDLRITKGYARYPYNFTAPTAAFPLFWQAAATPSSDPYFDYTTLLLPGNGTNGAQNNTFLDSSTNAFTITRNGNTTQGTFTPFSQTGWSNFFTAASSQVLSIANNNAFKFGAPSGNTNDFTVEFFVYPTGTAAYAPVHTGYSANNYWGFNLNRTAGGTNTAGYVLFYMTDSFSLTASSGLVANAWNHICVVRTGTTVSLYINGTQGATSTSSVDPNPTQPLWIGGEGTALGRYLDGYVSNVRIIKGSTQPYSASSSSITVPTGQLAPITGTTVLTCQSNRFVDNSSNALAITITNNPSVQAFSPFNPTAAYSTSTVGGSGYFDGTGDYLECSSNSAFSFGTGNLTVEAWIYRAASGTFPIFANGATSSGSFSLYVFNDKLEGSFYGGTTITGATSLAINAWNHVAIVRSGTTLSLYLNGTRDATTTSSSNNTSSNCVIARDWTNGSSYSNGYISNLRVVKGTAVYDPSLSTLTVPTAPLTAITNTSLLMSGTNAGIIDNTAKNNLETVGGASISTTVSKFGGSSMLFDGTGDWLLMPAGDKFAFGTGDYTVEAWVYFTSITTTDLQIIFLSGSTGGNNFYFHVDGNQISVGTSAAFISNQATSFSTATWYHVAACRYSGTLRLFVNGVQIGSSVSDSTNWISAGSARIGANEAGTQTVFGYINDHRVTKGIARYTTNFTPPTTAFLTL
jgi:hypothetical protein